MSEKLIDEITLHRIGIERFGTGLVKDIVRILDDAAEEIEGRLARDLLAIDERGFRMSVGARERLKRTLAAIQSIIAEGNEVIRAELEGNLKALAQYEGEFSRRLYQELLAVGANFTVPAPQLLAAIVTTDPFQGDILRAWARKMQVNQLDRIRQTINLGMVQGESIRQITDRLKGFGAEGRGGVWHTNRRGAESLVRTAVNHTSNRSHMMVLERNPALFKEYRWISVLDRRTTPICRSRAGTVYKVGEGPVPPAHWNCRSTIAPIVEGMDNESHPEYDDWLRRQPAKVQDDILGKSKGRLFREGSLAMKQFVNRRGEELTLKQLKQRESEAWRRAFAE